MSDEQLKIRVFKAGNEWWYTETSLIDGEWHMSDWGTDGVPADVGTSDREVIETVLGYQGWTGDRLKEVDGGFQGHILTMYGDNIYASLTVTR